MPSFAAISRVAVRSGGSRRSIFEQMNPFETLQPLDFPTVVSLLL